MDPASHYPTYWPSDSFVTHAAPIATATAYEGTGTYLTPSTATAAEASGFGLHEDHYPLSRDVYSEVEDLGKRKACKTKTRTKTFHETQTLYVTPMSGAANPTTTEYVPISTSPPHLGRRGEEGTPVGEDVQEYPGEYGDFVWSHDEESDLSEVAAREPKGRGGGKGWGKKKSGCTDYVTVFETAVETKTVVMTPEPASQTSTFPGEMTFGTLEFIPTATFESNAQGRPEPLDFFFFRRR